MIVIPNTHSYYECMLWISEAAYCFFSLRDQDEFFSGIATYWHEQSMMSLDKMWLD